MINEIATRIEKLSAQFDVVQAIAFEDVPSVARTPDELREQLKESVALCVEEMRKGK